MQTTVVLYYHHSRMLGMYRSGWHMEPIPSDDSDRYDDGPVEFHLPFGYQIAECASGSMEVFGPGDRHTEIVTIAGHPCVVDLDNNGNGIRLKPVGEIPPPEAVGNVLQRNKPSMPILIV